MQICTHLPIFFSMGFFPKSQPLWLLQSSTCPSSTTRLLLSTKTISLKVGIDKGPYGKAWGGCGVCASLSGDYYPLLF